MLQVLRSLSEHKRPAAFAGRVEQRLRQDQGSPAIFASDQRRRMLGDSLDESAQFTL